jgi:hypothetical protein
LTGRGQKENIPDGRRGLKLELDEALSERVKAVARANGSDPETLAVNFIHQGLDADWAEALEALEEYDRTGESIAAEQFIAELREAVEARFAKK